tara:strand:- start:248 stop:856 length:609 start_codon:yes stop_codon:yes gene_type:complete
MSNIVLQPNASGTGSITIATPNTNTDRTLNIPDVAGNIVTTGDTGSVTAGMVSGINQTSLPAGSLLQTIQTGTIARFTVSSTGTWYDSNTSLSITPSSTSSKILVTLVCPIVVNGTSQNLRGGIRILRGSTTIWNTYGFGETFQVRNADNEFNVLNTPVILDSPSSTSSVTYKAQGYMMTGNSLIFWESAMGQSMLLQEIKG